MSLFIGLDRRDKDDPLSLYEEIIVCDLKKGQMAVSRMGRDVNLSDKNNKSEETERRQSPADKPASKSPAASSVDNGTATVRSADLVRRAMGTLAPRL